MMLNTLQSSIFSCSWQNASKIHFQECCNTVLKNLIDVQAFSKRQTMIKSVIEFQIWSLSENHSVDLIMRLETDYFCTCILSTGKGT